MIHLDLRGVAPSKRKVKQRCAVCHELATFAETTVYNGSTIRLDGSVIRHPIGESMYFCDNHTSRDLP